jgi:pentatricopeptide repeat domain-containing protein 1
VLEAAGPEAAHWLLGDLFEARLFSFFPCTDVLPSAANRLGGGPPKPAVELDDPDFSMEADVELRCSEAFAAVSHFEKTHCLALQNMGYAYLQRRSDLVGSCLAVACGLGVREEAGHDAVLLMDRVMSTSLQLAPDLFDLLAAACVVVAAKQADGPGAAPALPAGADVEAASGLPGAAVDRMEWNVREVLGQDTAAVSTLRCLKLYAERLGSGRMDASAAAAAAGRSHALASGCLSDVAFLNCRPSVIAAAVLYVDRRSRGVIPFWPTMLAKLTGYQDISTPELSVAIKAAQRVGRAANGSPPNTSPSRSASSMQLRSGSGGSLPSESGRSSSNGSSNLTAGNLAAAAAAAAANAARGSSHQSPPLAVPINGFPALHAVPGPDGGKMGGHMHHHHSAMGSRGMVLHDFLGN